MNTRNPKYNYLGTIDCEIEHPVYGWIPFTASPDSKEKYNVDIYNMLVSNGNIAAGPTPADILTMKRGHAAMQRMDFMLALDTAGLLTQAQTLVADATTPARIKIMWDNATHFERNNTELVQMATTMGLTDAQMDAVFGIV